MERHIPNTNSCRAYNISAPHEVDLRVMFRDLISQGTGVPGLGGTKADDGEVVAEKLEWLAPLGFSTLAEVYTAHPVLRTYLDYHQNTKGQPMTLEGRAYLLNIIIDPAQKVIIQKCVQCGITEIALCHAYTAAKDGLSVLYTLPGHPERNRFVADRVDRHLTRIPYYRAMLQEARYVSRNKASDAKGLKHFGDGSLHFVGSNTVGEFSEFPADYLIVDERDMCNHENLGLARDRLTESAYKWELHISNPRAAGSPYRVGVLYDESDAKVWLVSCRHCGERQELDWYKHFVERIEGGGYKLRRKDGQPVCLKCGRGFNRLGPGRWVAKKPGRRSSGYKINKLFTQSADILDMFETFLFAAYNETLLQIFHGSELGEYYQPKSSHITTDMLIGCINPARKEWALPTDGPVVMGVDVGAVLNVKASVYKDGRRMACEVAALSTWGGLMDLVKRLRPACIVIDAEPEHHKVEEFAVECPYPVWACRFGSPNQIQEYKFDPMDARTPRQITANRTSTLDAAFADVSKGLTCQEWPVQAQFIDQFFFQMMQPVRIWQPEANHGAGRFVWTDTGEDHYRFADVYERLAAHIMDRTGIEVSRLR